MRDIAEDILIQASKGDMEAFEKIYKAASGFVYSVALRITNNRDDAEDVTQEVFMKIYKNLKNFHFRSSFKTWAYRITVNTAINARKKTLKETRRRGDYDVAVKTERVPEPAETPIEKEDKQKLLSSLLNVLNPDQRACIILREIERLSYKEISEVLKVNINTIRTRLKRAREALLAYTKRGVIQNEL